MCFGVNRLERLEKNLLGRCKERDFAELLGAVNEVGKAAQPGQESGCRAEAGTAPHISAVRAPGAPGRGRLRWPPQPRPAGKVPCIRGDSPQKRIWSGSLPAGIFSGFPLLSTFSTYYSAEDLHSLPRTFQMVCGFHTVAENQEIPH